MTLSRQLATPLVGLCVLALSSAACFGQGFGPGPGFDEPAGGAPESKPAAKPPRIKKKVTVKLPDQYRSKDADRDGQIGLYEWPRSDYAGFQRLDLNGDGFLTPQELVNGPSKRKSGDSRSYAASRGPGGRGMGGPARGFGPPPQSSSSSEPPVISKSNVEAERFFDLFDKDKNGKLTEDEFKKSSLLTKKFTDAGVALSFPLGKDEFSRLYPAAAK